MPGKITIKKPKERRDLEGEFLQAWRDRHGDKHDPVTQLHFAKRIGRQWRFDAAFVANGNRVAIEIDGGTHINGGHNRGAYLHETASKCNAAVLLGWRVIRFTTDDFKSPDTIARMIDIVTLAVEGWDLQVRHASLFPVRKPKKKKTKKGSDPLPGYGVNLAALGITKGTR